MRDWPWQMWVYMGIGVVVGLWYLRREGNPEQDYPSRFRGMTLLLIAPMWPIILLAMLANPPDKLKTPPTSKKPDTSGSAGSTSKGSGD